MFGNVVRPGMSMCPDGGTGTGRKYGLIFRHLDLIGWGLQLWRCGAHLLTRPRFC